MKKLKKIVILALIMCCLPISTFAENTAPVFFDVTIENWKADVKKSKPVSSTDNSELPVEVVTVTDGEPELIYKGRLGDYDNGMWNTTDFSDIQSLVILDWQNKDAPPRYIIPCAEFSENSAALTVWIFFANKKVRWLAPQHPCPSILRGGLFFFLILW